MEDENERIECGCGVVIHEGAWVGYQRRTRVIANRCDDCRAVKRGADGRANP